MNKKEFQSWAEEIATLNNITLGEILYSGIYYSPEHIRNMIFAATWSGREAVLKVYDDPRPSQEPTALQQYNAVNTSQLLKAPEFFAGQVITPNRGWLLMERLPIGGAFFNRGLSRQDRQELLRVFTEYRKNFPLVAPGAVSLVQQLRADEYHAFRIHRWLALADEAETQVELTGKPRLLKAETFLPLLRSSLKILHREFSNRPMIWCHGHFKGPDIYKTDHIYYLTDFAHTKMYPLGYELAFMFWADHLLGPAWTQSYTSWRQTAAEWMADLEDVAQTLEYPRPAELIRVSVIERLIGTILADIAASDRPRVEQLGRLAHSQDLLRELLKK